MTRQGTANVFQSIVHHEELAAEVADGDFTSFADEELTDAERALLQAAASELDAEVAGFGYGFDVQKIPAPPAPATISDFSRIDLRGYDESGPGIVHVIGHIGGIRPGR